LGEGEDTVERGLDLVAEEGVGREGRVAEPVVADHAALVRVGDGALLELPHGGEGLLHPGLHLLQEVVREPHPADVDEEAELLVLVQPLDVALPELDRVLLHRADAAAVLRQRLGRGRGGIGGAGAGEVGDGVGRAEEAEVGGPEQEVPGQQPQPARRGRWRRRRAGDGRHRRQRRSLQQGIQGPPRFVRLSVSRSRASAPPKRGFSFVGGGVHEVELVASLGWAWLYLGGGRRSHGGRDVHVSWVTWVVPHPSATSSTGYPTCQKWARYHHRGVMRSARASDRRRRGKLGR